MIVTPNKSLRLLSAAEGNEGGPLSPIRPNSSSVPPLATDGTPLSQLSSKVHSSCSTGRRSSRDGIGTGSNFEKCSSSKRRRVSDEENLGLTPMKLLSAFIESSSYRQPAEVESDYDSDEEEDAATRHEREKSDLLERLQEASSSRVLLEGGCDVVVFEIPRAKLYQSKDGEWINKGIVKIKFLKDVEKGEYTYGMIRMSMTSENLEETITVEINDMPVRTMFLRTVPLLVLPFLSFLL